MRTAAHRPRRRPKQLLLRKTGGWGGARPGAGRKPKGDRPGVRHTKRPALAARFPVHVTLRVLPHVYNLRSRRCFRAIERAFLAGRDRFGFRLNHFSVQGNHVHLLVEAQDARALARGLQGLMIRIAKGLDRVMGRTGRVFADRYHAHVLESPAEVRHALAYVLGNRARHCLAQGRRLASDFVDPYSSSRLLVSPAASVPVIQPRTWLLAHGWRLRGSPPRKYAVPAAT